MSAFLTGSRAYGSPRADSDIDVVVFMDKEEAQKILGMAITNSALGCTDGGYDDLGHRGVSIRYGPLNLIVEADPARFSAWRQATAELVARAPVTRDEAKAHIKALCGEAEEPAAPATKEPA